MFYASITSRVDVELIEHLESVSGKGKEFRDRSDALRHYVNLGRKFEALIKIHKDPKKRKEFESKFNGVMKESNVKQVLETLDPHEIEAIVAFGVTLISKKKEQMILDVSKS